MKSENSLNIFMITVTLVWVIMGMVIVDQKLKFRAGQDRCVEEHIAVWGESPEGERVFYWMDDLFKPVANQEL